MKKIILKGLGGFWIVGLAATTNAAGATLPTNIISSSADVVSLFCVALQWVYFFVMVVSIGTILFSAYKYLTANGDSEKVGEATRTLTYAVIAIAIILIARAVPLIVDTFLSSSATASNFNVCP